MEVQSSEAFPFPLNITRDDFADVANFDADAFLSKNHRYTSLDLLLADLTNLSKTLNQDLLALVNDEYTNFIQLGQSIGNCLALINVISVDIGKFHGVLGDSLQNLQALSKLTENVLQHKRRLGLLKNRAKLVILLGEQSASFETLLGLDVVDREPVHLQQKLRTLATLYLSITKIHSVIVESAKTDTSEESKDKVLCPVFDKILEPKVFSLKHEFKLYLDELLLLARKSSTYNDLLVELLHVYRVTGHTADAVKCLN